MRSGTYVLGQRDALARFKLAFVSYSDDLFPQDVPTDVRDTFKTYADKLQHKGVYAGTKHKRIVIPKKSLTQEHLLALGFKPVTIAIPETGQDQLTSYRHPMNTYHVHSHGDNWTMHQDEHPAATMIMASRPTLAGKAQALIEGVPHAVMEGVPGLGIYLKNQAQQAFRSTKKTMLDNLRSELGKSRRGDDGTYLAPETF